MSIRKAAMAALVAGSMVVVPTVAQAASANVSKLSVAQSSQLRSGAVIAKKNQKNLGGGSLIIALLAAAAVIGGIIIASGGGNNATSP